MGRYSSTGNSRRSNRLENITGQIEAPWRILVHRFDPIQEQLFQVFSKLDYGVH